VSERIIAIGDRVVIASTEDVAQHHNGRRGTIERHGPWESWWVRLDRMRVDSVVDAPPTVLAFLPYEMEPLNVIDCLAELA
jgi:hypothetical protein